MQVINTSDSSRFEDNAYNTITINAITFAIKEGKRKNKEVFSILQLQYIYLRDNSSNYI